MCWALPRPDSMLTKSCPVLLQDPPTSLIHRRLPSPLAMSRTAVRCPVPYVWTLSWSTLALTSAGYAFQLVVNVPGLVSSMAAMPAEVSAPSSAASSALMTFCWSAGPMWAPSWRPPVGLPEESSVVRQ
ncbi:hypothetical protein D3C74_323830 [compost metagenome]